MALTLRVSCFHIDLWNLCTCESLSGEEVSQSTRSELEDLFSKGTKDHTTDSRKEKGRAYSEVCANDIIISICKGRSAGAEMPECAL